MSITEVNKDTFWALIAQAKERCGQDQDAFHQWVEDRLVEMGLEQALNFDNIVRGYRDLAYKYGLWTTDGYATKTSTLTASRSYPNLSEADVSLMGTTSSETSTTM